MDADIHKSTEGRDVRDDARDFHSLMEVFYFMDILSERELLGCLTRVTARLSTIQLYILSAIISWTGWLLIWEYPQASW